jgi:predicted ester cyclase
MTADDKKKLARVYWEEIFSDGRLDLADEIATAGWAIHNPGVQETLRGPEAMKAVVRSLRAGFPDLRMSVQDQLAEGDRVVTRVTLNATHLGELMGIPPTGRRVEVGGLAIDRLEGEKLAERWGIFDLLGLLRQLGVMPEPKG